MNRALVDETDEALLSRANLRFYLDDSPRQTMDESRAIQTWKDVFDYFLDDYGPNGVFARATMWILVLKADDEGQVQFDIGRLARRTGAKSVKQVHDCLFKLEKVGWICRSSVDKGSLQPRLVDRAKRICRKLAWSVGHDVEVGTESSHKTGNELASVTIRQTSLSLAEPRRTLGGRTFFVSQNKTA